MAKQRNDYRLLRHGKGVDLSKQGAEIIVSFEKVCRFCSTKSKHNKTKRLAETGQWVYSFQCTNCGEKSFGGRVDSHRNEPHAIKGQLIKNFKEYLWDWVREHIETVVLIEFPNKINIFKGKIGTPRRHKGKPAYSSSDLHPDFIKYLDTPDYIKQLKQALKCLESDNPELFDYFFFRAAGYSFKQIHDTNHFGPLLKYNTGARAIKNGKYEPNGHCQKLNGRVDRFLMGAIPKDLLPTFSGGQEAVDEILNIEMDQRFTCPKCNASDPNCTLCRARKRKWDGTVPKWLLDSYERRIADGGIWTEEGC